jgi:glutamate/tyrosine decarboxylase-like PLP-dependent enzyme
VFKLSGAYLPVPGEHASFGYLGPESSRGARGLAVWATLRAYGREGYRSMVERHLALARRLRCGWTRRRISSASPTRA